MAKISKPVLWTLILGGGALIYVYATDPAPAGAAPAKTVVRNTSTKAKVDLILPIDSKVHFATLKDSPKNAFKPLVYSSRAGIEASAPDRSVIPGLLTDNEANWAFTGQVEVNGTKMALLENSNTGEGVYVRVGDHWKKSIVSSIDDETLVLVGPDSAPVTVKLGERGDKTNLNSAVAGIPTPVQPSLRGVIGAGNAAVAATGTAATATPLPGVSSNDLSVQPDPGSYGGGRRSRRWGQ